MSYNYGVPRNDDEVGQLLSERPQGWEYMLYAGALVIGIERLEVKYNDYALGYAPRLGTVIPSADFIHFIQSQLNELKLMTSSLNRLFTNEVLTDAVGAPGVAGNPDKIFHAASRVTRLYEDMLLWAERIRGLAMPEKYYHVVELLARFSEQPINELRDFTFRFAERMERLPSEIGNSSDEPIIIDGKVTFTISDSAVREFNTELESLMRRP
jgi:hypothetical protein